MIVRYEPWGAWVKLETMAAIVALDRDGVRALGLSGGAAWSEEAPAARPPIEVHLAVTARCNAGCKDCYLDVTPDGVEPPFEELARALDAIADAGAFTVAFGGGEPATRDDLGALAAHARSRGLVPVMTTSGMGAKGIAELRDFGQVNVSYDGGAAEYEAVRGYDGARGAEQTIARLSAAKVPVGVNVVLTRRTFDHLDTTIGRARELGAREAQLLRIKPSARAATFDYLAARLSPQQACSLGPLLRELSAKYARDEFRIRVDCALVPFLSADPDLASDPDKLARLGVFGCEAGGALAAVRVDGRVSPCSFAGPSDLHVSSLAAGYARDPVLERWRAYAEAPPCASCTLRPVCKGGCKVVASFALGAHGPDPECPRVRAHRGAAS